MQALIDYNSQYLFELRLLYHNFTFCKLIFSHNLNFLRKKPFIFIKNYTFYFGKYTTIYYLLMYRILQFPICVAKETPLKRVVVGLPEELSTRSPKKFIEQSDKNLQRLTISNPANQLKRFRVGDKRNLNSEFM